MDRSNSRANENKKDAGYQNDLDLVRYLRLYELKAWL